MLAYTTARAVVWGGVVGGRAAAMSVSSVFGDLGMSDTGHCRCPSIAPVLRLGSELGRVIRSPGRYSTEIEELT